MAAGMLQVRVVAVRQLAPDVKSLRLEHPEQLPLPAFTAGAHIDVHLPNDLIRHYSLCNDPADRDHYAIAVKREPSSRGGSAAMHDLATGASLSIGSPRNTFALASDAGFHLLLAGGIGITPLLSMARHLKRNAKPFRLEYFTRSLEHAPFRDSITEEIGTHAGFNAGLEPFEVEARLRDLLGGRPADAHAYVCGPSAFMSLAWATAARDWPAECVHLEHFSARPDVRQDANRPFRVTLAQANRQFDIPSGRSILDVLLDNGVPCYFSCKEGVCGSCMVAVLDGDIDHRDSYLSASERQRGEVMMICVSRARRGDLTIDL